MVEKSESTHHAPDNRHAPNIPLQPVRTARQWLQEGHKVAIATVVETWGSAPCPVGAHLCVRQDGHFLGAVSGGCIEGDVITRALELLQGEGKGAGDGEGLLLHYDVADKRAWEVGLACGGRMTVCLRPLSPPLAEELLRSETPPPRLMLIGAGRIAQSLCALAPCLGWRVFVIDPRAAFLTRERFPEHAALLCQWPEEALDAVDLGRDCAVVTLAHDPKLDDPALMKALASPCFYVAALGSRKNHAARLERLRATGISAESLARIHGPAGLDIGARRAEEIAVAILAQAIERLHKCEKSGEKKCEKNAEKRMGEAR